MDWMMDKKTSARKISTRKIAKKYGLDSDNLEIFIRNSGFQSETDWAGECFVSDGDVDVIVEQFRSAMATKLEKEQAEEEEETAAMQEAFSKMLITSGFSFDGYRITKYSGYISGDDAIQIPRGTDGLFSSATDVGAALMDSLAKIRRNALYELKQAAYNLGCNAVIGVDFDYVTLEPETANGLGGTTYLPYVFGVTANGNAVIIEKDETK